MAGLPGLRMAMTFACFQVCGYVPLLIISVKVFASQPIALDPRWVSISGYMPSIPAAFPFFMFFRASFISFRVTGMVRDMSCFGCAFKTRWHSFLILFSKW